MMKLDPVKQYTALRASLIAERNRLQTRLAAINGALGQVAAAATPAPAAVAAPAAKKRGRPPGRKRSENALSLKEAVAQVVKAGPMTKPEILSAVQKAGYAFDAREPMNSLNTLLYTPGNFKKLGGGKWGLLKK